MSFETKPIVKLEGVITDPYNLAVATARTCYSSKGIIRSRDVVISEKARALRDRIADSTRDAGHLTTRQHAHFVFSLDKVSRQFIWSFLHSHPFYNSEQVSQRYVKVKPDNYTVPLLPEKQRTLFKATLNEQMHDYQRLIEAAMPELEKRFFGIFPSRKTNADLYQKQLMKRAYEVARYVLGVATHAYLYHTISALTLMRYHRLCEYFDAPKETRLVVEMMVQEVQKNDPEFMREIKDPYPLEETWEYRIFQEFGGDQIGSKDFIKEFDDSLGENRFAKLLDYKVNAPQTLARSVRSVLGLTQNQMSDEQAIQVVLDPKKNSYFADTLNLNSLSKLNRTLFHPHYTFRKKISHSADSQDQRHRMVPGSRPVLHRHYTGEVDYIAPLVIRENDELLTMYHQSMEKSFNAINQLLNDGVAPMEALYLLPNAFPIRFEESGDLLNLHHKWKARSCYTAQEEIYFATIEELLQVKEVHPQIAEHILAPCYLRHQAKVTPFCPEGDRFCGVRVWKQDLKDYLGRTL